MSEKFYTKLDGKHNLKFCVRHFCLLENSDGVNLCVIFDSLQVAEICISRNYEQKQIIKLCIVYFIVILSFLRLCTYNK
jgi:hypothetical protein